MSESIQSTTGASSHEEDAATPNQGAFREDSTPAAIAVPIPSVACIASSPLSSSSSPGASPLLCDLCEEVTAVVECGDCAKNGFQFLCANDDDVMHSGKKLHHRIRLEDGTTVESTSTQIPNPDHAASLPSSTPALSSPSIFDSAAANPLLRSTSFTSAPLQSSVSSRPSMSRSLAPSRVPSRAASRATSPTGSSHQSPTLSAMAITSGGLLSKMLHGTGTSHRLSIVTRSTNSGESSKRASVLVTPTSLTAIGSRRASALALGVGVGVGTASPTVSFAVPLIEASIERTCDVCEDQKATVYCDTCRRDASIAYSQYCSGCNDDFHMSKRLDFHFRQSMADAVKLFQTESELAQLASGRNTPALARSRPMTPSRNGTIETAEGANNVANEANIDEDGELIISTAILRRRAASASGPNSKRASLSGSKHFPCTPSTPSTLSSSLTHGAYLPIRRGATPAEELAALRIQAFYRGVSVRRRLPRSQYSSHLSAANIPLLVKPSSHPLNSSSTPSNLKNPLPLQTTPPSLSLSASKSSSLPSSPPPSQSQPPQPRSMLSAIDASIAAINKAMKANSPLSSIKIPQSITESGPVEEPIASLTLSSTSLSRGMTPHPSRPQSPTNPLLSTSSSISAPPSRSSSFLGQPTVSRQSTPSLSTAACRTGYTAPTPPTAAKLTPASSPTTSPKKAVRHIDTSALATSPSAVVSTPSSATASPAMLPLSSPPSRGSFAASHGRNPVTDHSLAMFITKLDVLEARLRKEAIALNQEKLAFEHEKYELTLQATRESDALKMRLAELERDAANDRRRHLAEFQALVDSSTAERAERDRQAIEHITRLEQRLTTLHETTIERLNSATNEHAKEMIEKLREEMRLDWTKHLEDEAARRIVESKRQKKAHRELLLQQGAAERLLLESEREKMREEELHKLIGYAELTHDQQALLQARMRAVKLQAEETKTSLQALSPKPQQQPQQQASPPVAPTPSPTTPTQAPTPRTLDTNPSKTATPVDPLASSIASAHSSSLPLSYPSRLARWPAGGLAGAVFNHHVSKSFTYGMMTPVYPVDARIKLSNEYSSPNTPNLYSVCPSPATQARSYFDAVLSPSVAPPSTPSSSVSSGVPRFLHRRTPSRRSQSSLKASRKGHSRQTSMQERLSTPTHQRNTSTASASSPSPSPSPSLTSNSSHAAPFIRSEYLHLRGPSIDSLASASSQSIAEDSAEVSFLLTPSSSVHPQPPPSRSHFRPIVSPSAPAFSSSSPSPSSPFSLSPSSSHLSRASRQQAKLNHSNESKEDGLQFEATQIDA